MTGEHVVVCLHYVFALLSSCVVFVTFSVPNVGSFVNLSATPVLPMCWIVWVKLRAAFQAVGKHPIHRPTILERSGAIRPIPPFVVSVAIRFPAVNRLPVREPHTEHLPAADFLVVVTIGVTVNSHILLS
jgi:hypothetical protein